MSAGLENILARFYSDPEYLKRFLDSGVGALDEEALSDDERLALEKMDRIGLQMAAASYERKRGSHLKKSKL